MTAVNVSFSDFSPPPSGVSCSVSRGGQREEAASSHGDPFFSSVNSRPFRSHLSFHLSLFDYTQPQIIGTLTFPSFEVSLCGDIDKGGRVWKSFCSRIRIIAVTSRGIFIFWQRNNIEFFTAFIPRFFFLFIFRNGAGRYFLFYTRAWQQFVLI